MTDFLSRTRLLLGEETMRRVEKARVIVFGVGGVGSWCVESLVRSGIRDLTIVDCDKVSLSNINRQAMATTLTVGQVKVEAMRERLLSINPDALITIRHERFGADSDFRLGDYDYVVDAIDSLADKVELIAQATQVVREQREAIREQIGDAARGKKIRGRTTFFSSMGAALKIDPMAVRVSEFWEVDGCPLARALRKRMKKSGRYPASKFQCVWSPELLPNLGSDGFAEETGETLLSDKRPNGTLAHITAIFGFTLAGLVIKDIAN